MSCSQGQVFGQGLANDEVLPAGKVNSTANIPKKMKKKEWNFLVIFYNIPGRGCILLLISLASTSCFAGFGRSGGPVGPWLGSTSEAWPFARTHQRLVLWEGVMPQRPSRD